VAAGWRRWHASPHRRTEVGAPLPDLLTDCQDATQALDGRDRRAARAVPADTYRLARHVLVNAEPELLWLVVDRGMTAVQVADDSLALAGAAWTVGMMQ
jgi:hypothetical protein